MATTAYKGRSALAKISANGGSTFTIIGGTRTTNMTINNEPVDITNADSAGFKELMPDAGVQSCSLSIEGIIVAASTLKTMQAQMDDRTLIYYQFPFGAAGLIQSAFAISSFQIGAQYNGAQTFTASLESSGTIVITPDP